MFRAGVILLTSVLGLLVTCPAPAQEIPQSVQPQTKPSEALPAERPPSSARGSLLLTGTLVFAGWYGLAIGESYAYPDAPSADKLRIPVVGPWLTIAHAGCASGENCSTVLAVARAIVAGFSAVGQLGGLAALGEAAFLPTRQAERVPPPHAGIQGFSVIADDKRIGLGLSGAF